MNSHPDALARDSARRMKQTTLGRFRALQAERVRWQRKRTLADNKLARVLGEIETLAETLATEKLAADWQGDSNT